jgi:hypothetical protein
MVVNEKDKNLDKSSVGAPISPWAMALQDARRRLSESQGRCRQLRRAIQIIEQKIADGESWPGASATQN